MDQPQLTIETCDCHNLDPLAHDLEFLGDDLAGCHNWYGCRRCLVILDVIIGRKCRPVKGALYPEELVRKDEEIGSLKLLLIAFVHAAGGRIELPDSILEEIGGKVITHHPTKDPGVTAYTLVSQAEKTAHDRLLKR